MSLPKGSWSVPFEGPASEHKNFRVEQKFLRSVFCVVSQDVCSVP